MNTRTILASLLLSLLVAACASVAAVTAPILSPPYTVEQLQAANPPGTTVTHRLERPGQPVVFSQVRFLSSDARETTLEEFMTNAEGVALGDGQTSTVTWEELRDHAAFPASSTRRSESSCEVRAGSFDCWVYTVSAEKDGVATTSRFYFAKSLPGPPVLYEQEREGELALRMSLVGVSRPAESQFP